jgi:hypothetical protein
MASSSRCSAASLLLQLALLAACCVGAALAGDRTLGTVSGPCKDQFAGIMKEQYGDDASCADKIKKAMSVAPKSDADCPGGTKANVGSDIQKCMAKNQVRACSRGRGACRVRRSCAGGRGEGEGRGAEGAGQRKSTSRHTS